MSVLPNQTPGLNEQFNLSREQVDWELWAVAADGSTTSAAAAINRTLQELGGVWALIATLYRFAPLRWIEDRVYRWVADHRPWLSRWIGAPPEWEE